MDAVLGTTLEDVENLSVLHTSDQVIALMSVFHVLNDLLNVLSRVEVGDLAVVEDIVDIFDEGLIDDLSIG